MRRKWVCLRERWGQANCDGWAVGRRGARPSPPRGGCRVRSVSQRAAKRRCADGDGRVCRARGPGLSGGCRSGRGGEEAGSRQQAAAGRQAGGRTDRQARQQMQSAEVLQRDALNAQRRTGRDSRATRRRLDASAGRRSLIARPSTQRAQQQQQWGTGRRTLGGRRLLQGCQGAHGH